MHNMIRQILEKKKKDVANIKYQISNVKRDDKETFIGAIKSVERPAIIAELKFASPTNPHLGSREILLRKAKEYQEAGATAISIITEKHFFKGDPLFVTQVKKEVTVPILQKDFVIDRSQIDEAKELGSDALLLIARIVDIETLKKFVDYCLEQGIEPVVEIANEEDLTKAIATQTRIIAVNARDLDTFEVHVETACRLLEKIPVQFVRFGFSGVQGRDEFVQYTKAGADAILIGTKAMKESYVATFFKTLRYE